jgi:hypothetical protein
MDIRLIRRPHTNQMVRASGSEPTDPYLELCWLPVVGPSTVALVRHVAHLTASGDEARIPLSDLGRQLGLGTVDVPSRNNKLVRTLGRAEQFGLGFTSIGIPGESMTFGIYSEIALVPTRLLRRLPEAAMRHHAAAVEGVNEALAAAGLPALRSLPPTTERVAERPGAAGPAVPAGRASQPAPGVLHAVPPIARLDSQVSRSTPPPELSL